MGEKNLKDSGRPLNSLPGRGDEKDIEVMVKERRWNKIYK